MWICLPQCDVTYSSVAQPFSTSIDYALARLNFKWVLGGEKHVHSARRSQICYVTTELRHARRRGKSRTMRSHMHCLSMQMLEERHISDTLGCFDSRILGLTNVCVCVLGCLCIFQTCALLVSGFLGFKGGYGRTSEVCNVNAL